MYIHFTILHKTGLELTAEKMKIMTLR